MPATLETNLRAEQYNAQRQLAYLPEKLYLHVVTPQEGHNEPREISTDWVIAKEDDKEEGTQYWVIRIAMTDVNVVVMERNFVRKVSAVSFNGLYYRLKDVVEPFGEPSVYIIKAHPTGEKKL